MATEAKNTINIANLEDLYALMRNSLEYDLGSVGLYLFGFGMFAAGFSSAVTSPLASAITAKSLFSNKYNKHKWEGKAPYFKLIIIGVLSVGLTFGFLGIKPLPAILMAQAFNGLILPLIAVFLIYVINDSKVMGKANLNGWVSNIAMGVVLFITIMLGFNQITDAVTNALDITLEENALLTPLIIGSAIISLLILLLIYRNRIKSQRHEPENALANS
jgi:Mn2+/Fe2+ NRAMP family transporter